MQLEQSLELIQRERQPYKDGSPATPIFLIHDGSGTTVAYHCLGSLSRSVFGISNPYINNPTQFNGGLADLGELYTTWIRTTVAKDDFPVRRANDGRIQIYVGGWSLGGMLSLEIAKRLVKDDNINVVGVLMVDAGYPRGPRELTKADAPKRLVNSGLTRSQIMFRMLMKQAGRMVDGWEIPVWNGDDASLRPKIALLQAKKCIPDASNPSLALGLDVYREDDKLGWGKHDECMFTQVFPVDGHHFDLFSVGRVEETTRVIKKALDTLDESL